MTTTHQDIETELAHLRCRILQAEKAGDWAAADLARVTLRALMQFGTKKHHHNDRANP